MDSEYYRKWYGFALVSTAIPAVVGVFTISQTVFGRLPAFVFYVLIAYLFVITIQSIACLAWYYRDAQVLDEANADWKPFAGLWTVAHVLLSPFITAPLYLLIRTRNTGYPPRVEQLLGKLARTS